MADSKRKQSPQSEFLGGGPKFNKVGLDNKGALGAGGAEDPGPTLVPTKITSNGLRSLTIVIVIVLLVSFLYFFSQRNGAYQGRGRSSADPTDVTKARQPDSNF